MAFSTTERLQPGTISLRGSNTRSVDPRGPPPAPLGGHWAAPLRRLGFAFPTGVVLGEILAWKREGHGGALTLASFLAFHAYMFILGGRFPRTPYFAFLAAPGVLFVLCWAASRSSAKRIPRR